MNPDQNALTRARALIYGDRAADYGDPVENFDRLAALWSPVLGVTVTAQQVCLCLNQLKVSRLIHQPGHQDSIDDAAGYIGCYDRVTNERPPVDPWQQPAPPRGETVELRLSVDTTKFDADIAAGKAAEERWKQRRDGTDEEQLDDPLDRLAAEIEVEQDTRLDGRPAPFSPPAERTPIPPELARTTLHPVTQEALAKIDDPKLSRRVVDKVAAKDRAKVNSILPSSLGKPATIKKGEAPPEGWLPLTEAWKAYGCAYQTLHARCAAGTVESVKHAGRRWVPPPKG